MITFYSVLRIQQKYSFLRLKILVAFINLYFAENLGLSPVPVTYLAMDDLLQYKYKYKTMETGL